MVRCVFARVNASVYYYSVCCFVCTACTVCVCLYMWVCLCECVYVHSICQGGLCYCVQLPSVASSSADIKHADIKHADIKHADIKHY
uniref:Uncharacterized protein n=1 Tax=Octopus bimaculoides TaxID=37653 RepID=A0A0L8GGF9_OCTBM